MQGQAQHLFDRAVSALSILPTPARRLNVDPHAREQIEKAKHR
jgi:hypothetical protein